MSARRFPAARLWLLLALVTVAVPPASAQISYLEGHTEPVYVVTYSPDGSLLVSGSFDKTVRIWDRTSGQTRRTLAYHDNLVLAVAVSPDGRQVASGGLDKLVFVDEMPPSGLLAQLPAMAAQPRVLEISSDGKLLAAADAQGVIVLYDVESAQSLRELAAETEVTALRFTADNKQLLAAGADGSLHGWAVEDAAPTGSISGGSATKTFVPLDAQSVAVGGEDGMLRVYRWPAGEPTTVAVSSPVRAMAAAPDGSWVAVASEDGKVRFYNPQDAAELRTIDFGATGALVLAVRSDGGQLAVAGGGPAVRFYNPADGAAAGELPSSGAAVRAIAYHPQGGQLAVAAEDGTARLWRLPLEADRETAVAETSLKLLELSPDGQLVATVGSDHLLRLLKAADGSEVRSVPLGEKPIHALTVTPGGDRVLVAGDEMRIRIVAVATGGVLSLESQGAAVQSLAVSPDGKHVAAGAADANIRIWNLADGAFVRELKGHGGPVIGVAYLAEGSQLVSAGDNTVRIWNAGEGSETRAIDAGMHVTQFSITRDGSQVAVGGEEGAIRVFKTADGSAVAEIAAGGSAINSLRFTTAGQRLAAAYADASIKVFQIAGGRELLTRSLPSAASGIALAEGDKYAVAVCEDGRLRTISVPIGALLAGHEGATSAVAYTPDGARLVTAGADHSVQLWNLETAAAERSFAGLDSPVLGVAVSPDGASLAACAEGGQVRVWKLDDATEIASFQLDAAARSLAWAADGRLAVAGDDKRVHILDVAKKTIAETYQGHDGAVLAVAVAADGKAVFSGGADGTLRIWSSPLLRAVQAHNGKILAVTRTGDGSQLLTVGVDRLAAIWNSADLAQTKKFELSNPPPKQVVTNRAGSLFAAAGEDRKIHVWNVAEAKEIATLETPQPIAELALAEDGAIVHVVDTDGAIRTQRASDGMILQESAEKVATASAPVLASDGRSLFAAGAEPAIGRLSVPASQPRLRLEGHESHIYGVAFSSDSTRLASAGANKVIKLWNTADGANYANCAGHESQVYGVAFHPSQDQLASCGADKSVRLWNPADGAELKKITEGIDDGLYSVAWSPDGAKLLAAGLAKSWQVWNAGEDAPKLNVTGHSDHVYRALYNPAGTRVATLGYSGSLFIWDAETGNKLHEEQLPVAAAYSLAYSPDGAELAIGSVDSRVLLVTVPEAAR